MCSIILFGSSFIHCPFPNIKAAHLFPPANLGYLLEGIPVFGMWYSKSVNYLHFTLFDLLVSAIMSAPEATNRDQLLAELDRRIPRLMAPTDVTQSAQDLALFRTLYQQFLDEPHKVDWDRIKPMPPEAFVAHEELPVIIGEAERQSILSRLVVVKLNGGLGTTMGCKGTKSLVELREGLTFMDFALRQHSHLNARSANPVPLLLMNSFNTDAETKEYLRENAPGQSDPPGTFCQSKCPRIFADSLLPVPNSWDDCPEEGWYPPGHGNAFKALVNSGLLDGLLAEGRDLAFFANIDNTGAIVDEQIAKLLADGRADYVMEMTPRTAADVKGGTLVEVDGGKRLMHLECPQVPEERVDEFCSLRTFKMFNTNNIWVNLAVVKRRLEEFHMEILANEKCLSGGKHVIQLEQSIGGAIRNFPGRAMAVCVSRERFLPVKSTRDLFRLRAPDLFAFCPKRCLLRQRVPALPEVHLSPAEFGRLADFERRIPEVPRMCEAKSVCLEGNVWIGRGVQMRGVVEVRAADAAGGQTPPVRIEDNAIIGHEEEEGEVNEQKPNRC